MNNIIKFREYLIFIALTMASVSSCATTKPNQDAEAKVVETALGQLILRADSYARYDHGDSNPFGIAEAFVLFRETYQNEIRLLKPENRTNYIWSVMWHLDLDGGYLTEFIDIISKDDTSLLEEKLNRYISIEGKLKRNPVKLNKCKIILHGLSLN